MPPLPVVPNVVKIVIGGTYHDTAWLNIFHQQYDNPAPSASTLSTLLSTVWQPAVDTAYAAEMSVDNEVTSLEALDLSSDLGASAAITDSTFGVRTGDFVPASVAMVCSHEIARRYRGGHPRSYLPWGTAGTYATSSTKDWDSGFVTDCQAKFNALASSINGHLIGGTEFHGLVNVSYRSGGTIRTSAVVDQISSSIIRTRICSQRRRLGRVGG